MLSIIQTRNLELPVLMSVRRDILQEYAMRPSKQTDVRTPEHFLPIAASSSASCATLDSGGLVEQDTSWSRPDSAIDIDAKSNTFAEGNKGKQAITYADTLGLEKGRLITSDDSSSRTESGTIRLNHWRLMHILLLTR
jgi:hypothetical protein